MHRALLHAQQGPWLWECSSEQSKEPFSPHAAELPVGKEEMSSQAAAWRARKETQINARQETEGGQRAGAAVCVTIDGPWSKCLKEDMHPVMQISGGWRDIWWCAGDCRKRGLGRGKSKCPEVQALDLRNKCMDLEIRNITQCWRALKLGSQISSLFCKQLLQG